MTDNRHIMNNMDDSEGSVYDRLFYPYLFEGGTANLEDVLAQARHSTLEKCHEVVALRQATLDSYRDRIVEAGMAMAHAFAAGATLFAFGNGGSTTDAQDIVADLTNPPVDFGFWILDFGLEETGKPKTQNPKSKIQNWPAIALTNDIAVVTAVANDVGFDNVFARQIIAFGRPGDIAFGVTTSGNSTNVLVALEQAKKQGMMTIGLAGYDGGKMSRSPSVDFCITAHSDHIPRIQEAQATVYHALLDIVWALTSDE